MRGRGALDSPFEAQRLGARHRAAEGRQLVVPPAFVVDLGVGPFVEFNDEAAFEQAGERAVERPRQQRFARAFADVGEDGVAVPIVDSERDEDLEHDCGQGQK